MVSTVCFCLVVVCLFVHTAHSVRIIGESVQCDPLQMHVLFEFAQPFYGVVHAEHYAHLDACRINGQGGRKVTLTIPLNTDTARTPYCGVKVDVSLSNCVKRGPVDRRQLRRGRLRE